MTQPEALQLLLWDLPAADLRVLLEAGAKVNEPDDLGDYFLTVACHRLEPDSVRLLLDSGANPNVRNADRDTPLLCAIDYVEHDPEKAVQIVQQLVEAGADLEARGYMDKTPFLKACSRSSVQMVKKLVELGADHRAVVEDDGVMDGAAFADIFHAPLEIKQSIGTLQ
jgi:ankyrin repeat protein